MLHIKISKQHKEEFLEELMSYFEKERDERLGNLEAEDMMNFFITALGPLVYNQAIEDARTVLMDRYLSLEEELYALKRLEDRKNEGGQR
jgi:uncharacterized protein (DUF2164 family)